jgi:3-(3-hydroxy-phenyl)propionate hydroxylase
MPAVYPPSPLVHGTHAHAGRALPNIVLRQADGLSLHALLGPWFTVLVFGEALPPEAAVATHADARVHWVAVGPLCDARGRAALAHQLGLALDGATWLVRPDQHLMAAGDAQAFPPAQITTWIDAALGRADGPTFPTAPAHGLRHSPGDSLHAALTATA